MSEPLLVAVTGPPAAGKTTIARDLAAATQLPLCEEDAISVERIRTLCA